MRLERHAKVRGQITGGFLAEDGSGLSDQLVALGLGHAAIVVGVVVGTGAAGIGFAGMMAPQAAGRFKAA